MLGIFQILLGNETDVLTLACSCLCCRCAYLSNLSHPALRTRALNTYMVSSFLTSNLQIFQLNYIVTYSYLNIAFMMYV